MTSSLVYNFMSNQQANSLDIDVMNVSNPIFCLPPAHIHFFFVPGFSTLVKIVSPIPELVDNWDSSIKSFHTTQATPRARKMLCRDSTGRTKKDGCRN